MRAILAPQQHRRHLGVGLAAKLVTLFAQLVLDRGEVLDDAVVDQRELVVVCKVRVGVGIRGATVGSPARVPDARRARGERMLGEVIAQDTELARPLAHTQVAVAVDDGNARRVVAAVLQARQSSNEDGLTLTRPDIPDDSTHSTHATGRGCAHPAPPPGIRDGAICGTPPASRRCQPAGRPERRDGTTRGTPRASRRYPGRRRRSRTGDRARTAPQVGGYHRIAR